MDARIGVAEGGESSVITPRHGVSAGLKLKAAQDVTYDLVALGEVMLRFDPGEGRITRTRRFDVCEGGGEYNVARGLRRCFGKRTAIVTALADNAVGRLIEGMMLEGGVDLSHVRWSAYDGVGREARNGVYFLERGHGVRGAVGMMDRGHTPISQLKVGQVDWDALFGREGARWFHTGGIMAALSEDAPALMEEAMQSARSHGAVVSFDCNYRGSLWKGLGGRKAAVEVNRRLMPYVDVLFGHEGDLVSGEASDGPPWHDAEGFAAMSARLTGEFTGLKVIASTMRRARTAMRNDWAAFGFAEGAVYRSVEYPELDVLDRVGGGDAFAAGLVYGLLNGKGMQWAVDCGVAHGALTMTTAGDQSQATLAEVEALMAGASAGVQR